MNRPDWAKIHSWRNLVVAWYAEMQTIDEEVEEHIHKVKKKRPGKKKKVVIEESSSDDEPEIIYIKKPKKRK